MVNLNRPATVERMDEQLDSRLQYLNCAHNQIIIGSLGNNLGVLSLQFHVMQRDGLMRRGPKFTQNDGPTGKFAPEPLASLPLCVLDSTDDLHVRHGRPRLTFATSGRGSEGFM